MPMPIGGRLGRASRFPLEYDFCDGFGPTGLPVVRSGQTPTFTRGGTVNTASAVDRLGHTYVAAPTLPRYHHLYNPSTGLWDAVGLLLEGAESGHAAETFKIPYNRRLGALTLYLRFVRGARDVPAAIVALLGGVTGVRLTVYESADSGYSATYTNDTLTYTSTVATRLLMDQRVELRVVLDPAAANVVTLYQSVACAPEEHGSTSGPIITGTLDAALSTPQLCVGSDGTGSRCAANAYAHAIIGVGTVAIAALRPVDAPVYVGVPSAPRVMQTGVPRLMQSGVTRYTE